MLLRVYDAEPKVVLLPAALLCVPRAAVVSRAVWCHVLCAATCCVLLRAVCCHVLYAAICCVLPHAVCCQRAVCAAMCSEYYNAVRCMGWRMHGAWYEACVPSIAHFRVRAGGEYNCK